MEVMTLSSSAAARTPFATRLPSHQSPTKKSIGILAFKTDKTNNTALVSSNTSKETPKSRKKSSQALSTAVAPYCPLDLDYLEAAAKLNRIYNLSPTTIHSDDTDAQLSTTAVDIVRGQYKRFPRLTLENVIHRKNMKDFAVFVSYQQKREYVNDNEDEKINHKLVRDHSPSTNLGSLDWKQMKIPHVLPSSEHTRLFKLLETIKVTLKVKEDLGNVLEREPTDKELAESVNMYISQLRKHIGLGQAARNTLIKV